MGHPLPRGDRLHGFLLERVIVAGDVMVSTRTGYEGLKFGGALKWYEEARFYDEMGISSRAFRGLCRAIKVPMVEIGDKRFVCLPMFKIAMWAISRIGEPNFFCPGSASSMKSRKGGVKELDVKQVKEDMAVIISELIMARKLEGVEVESDVNTLARLAADRLVAAAAHIQPQLFYREWSDGAQKNNVEGLREVG